MGNIHEKVPNVCEFISHNQTRRSWECSNDTPILQRILDVPSTLKKHKSATQLDKNIPLDAPARVDRICAHGLSQSMYDIIEDATRDMLKSTNFHEVLTNSHDVKLKLQALSCFTNVDVHIDVSKGPKATLDGLEVSFYVQDAKRIFEVLHWEGSNADGSAIAALPASKTFVHGESHSVLTVEYGVGLQQENLSYGFIKPFMGNYHKPKLYGSVFHNVIRLPWAFYSQFEHGALLDFGFFSSRYLHHNIRCNVSKRKLIKEPFKVKGESVAKFKSSLSHSLTFDGRDNSIFPSRGSLINWTIEGSDLGGNVRFIKNDIHLQTNITIAEDVVLQVRFETGQMKRIGKCGKIALPNRMRTQSCNEPGFMHQFVVRGLEPRPQRETVDAVSYFSTGVHLCTPLPFRLGKGGFGDNFKANLFLNTERFSDYCEGYKNKWWKGNFEWSSGIGIIVRLGQMGLLEISCCAPIKPDYYNPMPGGLVFRIGMQL